MPILGSNEVQMNTSLRSQVTSRVLSFASWVMRMMDIAQTLNLYKQIFKNEFFNYTITKEKTMNLQEAQEKNPGQRPLLCSVCVQSPNHRHWQTQNDDISQEVCNPATNGKSNRGHAFGISVGMIPKSLGWDALEDCSEEYSEVPA